MNGFNLRIGILYAISKNFPTSPTLLVLLFIMLNNGKNGICLLILKNNLFLANGMKSVIVWENLSLLKSSEEIVLSLLLLTSSLIKMEIRTSFILLTRHLKAYMLTQTKILLLYLFYHLVLIHMLSSMLSLNKKMPN